METLVQSLIREESSRFIESIPWRFSYGTAGFRDKAERLDRVLFRVGVLAALRSKVVGGIDLQMNNVMCTNRVPPHFSCSYYWSGHYRFTQSHPSMFI